MYIRIRNLREDSDCTQAQMAKILNCSQQVYSNYELGQRGIPTDILIKIAKLYNVTTDYLLGLSDVKNPYGGENDKNWCIKKLWKHTELFFL